MREIKFRVWDKRGKGMMITPSYKDFELSCWIDEQNWTLAMFSQGGEFIESTEDVVLMQYTGLKDSQGKEIYEGDVVSFTETQGWENPDIHGLYQVKWNEEDLRLDFFCPWSGEIFSLANTDFDYVIGNIYENPELLEAQNGKDSNDS